MPNQLDVDVCLGVALIVDENVTLHIVVLKGRSKSKAITRHHGGPQDHAPTLGQERQSGCPPAKDSISTKTT